MTTVAAFTEMLGELLLAEGFGEVAFEADEVRYTDPMTRDDGLVVQFRNGDEFQLTIVQRASGPEPVPAGDAIYDVGPHSLGTTGGWS